MEEKELTEILNKEETKKGLVEVFYDSLRNLFTSFKSGHEADAAVIAQAQSDEEIETYKELCEDIHVYHQNLRELQKAKENNPGLTNSEWMESKLEETVNDIIRIKEGREMTDEEKNRLKAEYSKALDDEIGQEAAYLENVSGILSKELLNDKKEVL